MNKPMPSSSGRMWPFRKATWYADDTPSSSFSEEEKAYGESQETLLPQEKVYAPKRSSLLAKIIWGCKLLVKTTFAVSYIFLVFLAWKESRRPDTCVLGDERIFNDPPVYYETTHFQRAGFHDSRHDSNTEYEGTPNTENDAAWDHLLDVGVVNISGEENSRLAVKSASTVKDPNKYMVQLEMFHQLHCLKWVRDQFWGLQYAYETSSKVVEFPQRVNHTDHCIDYLRQVIMCNGDLTPITFEYNAEIQGYLARHSIAHQCRNFDAIFHWADVRRTPGMTVRGSHKNVNLEHAEISD
ncbi:hypothetical protein V8C37DRAFT_418521 [Trichoderma ceciliae]